MGAENFLSLVRTCHREAIGHIHVVMLIKGRVVVQLPDGVELVKHLWRNGVLSELTDDILVALLRMVLADEVEHTELQCLTLLHGHVEGDFVHVVYGC